MESCDVEERVWDGFHQNYEKTAVADMEFMGGFATCPNFFRFFFPCLNNQRVNMFHGIAFSIGVCG